MKQGTSAFLGVFAFTLLMITREGMETALLMGTLLFQVKSIERHHRRRRWARCVAAFVAWLWSRYGHRVNLALFFQVTAVFLLVFVVQLLIYGFHELTEANIFPYSEPLHWATEPYGPDGRYGQYLTYLLVMLPLGWLAHQLADAAPRRGRAVRQGIGPPSGPRIRLESAGGSGTMTPPSDASAAACAPLRYIDWAARPRRAHHDPRARARRVDAPARTAATPAFA